MSEPDHGPVVPISAPMTGTVIDLTDVPDPVFSSKAVGDGLGIEPADDGAIVSPVDATVTMVAGTGHAIGFKSESGLEILLHLGVDTVELEGAPFDLSVKVGDTVKAGQSLGTMDLEAVRAVGKATAAIVVLTNTITHLARLNVTTGSTDAGTAIAPPRSRSRVRLRLQQRPRAPRSVPVPPTAHALTALPASTPPQPTSSLASVAPTTSAPSCTASPVCASTSRTSPWPTTRP